MDEKSVIINNKGVKPDNIIREEAEIFSRCNELENSFPKFLKGFFLYLKSSVLPKTRLAYLNDIKLFLYYILESFPNSGARDISQITIEDFKKIKARDINLFLEYSREYTIDKYGKKVYFTNGNKSIARKKSSVSGLFKFLYRDELLDKNITDGFNPVRIEAPGEKEIKALRDDEVILMLDAVSTGEGLSKKELEYWEKTKYRDKAILLIFLTYGLRISELQQMNLSSFNFQREEFKIYRKRGKESIMPLNRSVSNALEDYITYERYKEELIDVEHKDALFLSMQKKRLTTKQIRSLVKKYTSIALKTTREKGYSPHKLRATAATSLIGRGMSIYDVAALLDHDQVTTTELYARHKENVKRDLVYEMEWEKERTLGDKE